jgi:hypothetical protein
MGYANSDSLVRADRFKPSGKWHDSFAIEMSHQFNSGNLHDGAREAIEAAIGGPISDGWAVVVLEPYHKHSHPIMIKGSN